MCINGLIDKYCFILSKIVNPEYLYLSDKPTLDSDPVSTDNSNSASSNSGSSGNGGPGGNGNGDPVNSVQLPQESDENSSQGNCYLE